MMRLPVLWIAAALVFACLGPARAPAQYLPDLDYPDAPLSLGQEDVVARIGEEDPNRFSQVADRAGLEKKPLAEWTQRDLAKFRRSYDAYLRDRISPLSPAFDAYESAVFFENIFESDSDGGDDGSGEGGDD